METKPKAWESNADYATGAKFAKFQKQHPLEYKSLFANLSKIVGLLDSGHKIGGFNVGFFRSEGNEVYRIGQTGVPHAKESRLYIYPDQSIKTLYILTIGDKDSQQDDINTSKTIVSKIQTDRQV